MSERFPVESPVSGTVLRTVPLTSAAAVAASVDRARGAQPGWLASGFAARARIMRTAQRWLLDHAERVIQVVVQETGKTHEDAQSTDLLYTVQALGFWARHAERYLAEQRLPSWGSPVTLGKRLALRHVPVGVVGVIGPWNFPLVNGFGDCVPALMAGNAVVLKPSEVTPLSSLLMAEMFAACGMPTDVFQVATGDGGTGAALVGAVDCVMFTGSTATGRDVARAAADALIPCHLELGGKDPMIVCADADPVRAANAAVFYSMNNAGQACVSVERVYVEAPVYEEFVQRVVARAGALRQGPPDAPGVVDVGAVTFAPQQAVIERQLRDAVTKGARVLVGGHARLDRGGRYFEPTVLVDVDHGMEVMREETFGPVLPIMRVSDLDQAVALANDSPYGLQASVWSGNAARGERIARRLQAGAVCVNAAQLNYYALNLPMGGWKRSGIGVRHGAAGIQKYCRTQSVLVSRLAPRREPFMFPYRAPVTRMMLRAMRLLYGRGRTR